MAATPGGSAPGHAGGAGRAARPRARPVPGRGAHAGPQRGSGDHREPRRDHRARTRRPGARRLRRIDRPHRGARGGDGGERHLHRDQRRQGRGPGGGHRAVRARRPLRVRAAPRRRHPRPARVLRGRSAAVHRRGRQRGRGCGAQRVGRPTAVADGQDPRLPPAADLHADPATDQVRPDLGPHQRHPHRAGVREHVPHPGAARDRHEPARARDRGLQHDVRAVPAQARPGRLHARRGRGDPGPGPADRLRTTDPPLVARAVADGAPAPAAAEPVRC